MDLEQREDKLCVDFIKISFLMKRIHADLSKNKLVKGCSIVYKLICSLKQPLPFNLHVYKPFNNSIMCDICSQFAILFEILCSCAQSSSHQDAHISLKCVTVSVGTWTLKMG